MVMSWGGADDWSRRDRAADDAPDSRAQIPAERWAALAARHRPREARHVGRESYRSLAGRLAALEVAHESLATRHAALVAVYDRLLADRDALADERDAWRLKAADLNNRLNRAVAELRAIQAGHLSWFVGGAALVALVFGVLYLIGA